MSKQWEAYAHHVIEAIEKIDPMTVKLVVTNHLPHLLDCVKTMLQKTPD